MRRWVVLLGLAASLTLPALRGPDAVRVASPRPRLVHVVQPGDTLWRVAARIRPDEDPRAVVDRLMDDSGLADPVLRPGQALYLRDR